MKYYLHDTSAFEDEKVAELYIEFGYEGVGLFYVILEKLGKQEKPVKTEVLKKQLRVGKKLEKCWNYMEEIGIISSNNGETFNKQLLNFSEKYKIKKEKTRKKVEEWRANQENTESVTGYVPNCNQPKVKESKVNVIKEEKENKFSPPTITEVKDYFDKNGYNGHERFFDGYEVANWFDSKGKKIINWKQKAQHVWFKNENKVVIKNLSSDEKEKLKTDVWNKSVNDNEWIKVTANLFKLSEVAMKHEVTTFIQGLYAKEDFYKPILEIKSHFVNYKTKTKI